MRSWARGARPASSSFSGRFCSWRHEPVLACVNRLATVRGMTEILFQVQEDSVDGGFVATALGHAIATQGDTVEELREMVRDAVKGHFGDGAAGPSPKLIRLHFVRDEVLAL